MKKCRAAECLARLRRIDMLAKELGSKEIVDLVYEIADTIQEEYQSSLSRAAKREFRDLLFRENRK